MALINLYSAALMVLQNLYNLALYGAVLLLFKGKRLCNFTTPFTHPIWSVMDLANTAHLQYEEGRERDVRRKSTILSKNSKGHNDHPKVAMHFGFALVVSDFRSCQRSRLHKRICRIKKECICNGRKPCNKEKILNLSL